LLKPYPIGQSQSHNLRKYKNKNTKKLDKNLSLSRTRAQFCQLITGLPAILFQLKLTILKLEVLNLTFSAKKKDMNTDKLAINWRRKIDL